MTSPLGDFYDFRNLTIQEKKEKSMHMQVGDILFFHTQSLSDSKPTKENCYPGHVALYLGENKFIHAKASSGRVLISNLEEEDYLEILVGYKDLVPYILTIYENEEIRTL